MDLLLDFFVYLNITYSCFSTNNGFLIGKVEECPSDNKKRNPNLIFSTSPSPERATMPILGRTL